MAHPPELPAAAGSDAFVRVRGAREHNLQDLDVDIPRDRLVVFSGVSGSGKSSLAFGTLYAESQRRFFESVSPYARRLIDQAGVPQVERIDGLPPAIALQQQRGTGSARSSVGSITHIAASLRLLYSRAGDYPPGQPMLFAEDFSPNTPQGACPTCHGIGRRYDATEATMVPDRSLTIRERAIASWPPAWHGQNLRDILVSMGIDVDVPWRSLPKKQRDWILFTEETPTVPVYAGLTPAQTRQARKRGAEPSYQGTFTGARRYLLQTFATTQSALMKRRVARFLTGADCPACQGKRLRPAALSVRIAGRDIGEMARETLARLDEILRPLAEGAGLAGEAGVDASTRTADPAGIAAPARRSDPAGARASAAGAREPIASATGATPSPPRTDGSHANATDVRRTPNGSIEKRLVAQRMATEMRERLQTLLSLGLGYLTLDRRAPTLSPGETQRLRLATQIGSQLFGVVYVLDEPTAGLHPVDGAALLDALARLRAAGNSLFVVEHDLDTMRRADWIVDVGPGAGVHGGRVLYSGPPDGLRGIPASQTARYLFERRLPPAAPAPRDVAHWLQLVGLRCHNLVDVDVHVPLGVMTAVTGVSGSGKSSLVSIALVDLVAAALARGAGIATDARGGQDDSGDEDGGGRRGAGRESGASHDHDDEPDPLAPSMPGLRAGRLQGGLCGVRRLVRVDQKPIGRTPRSNLATYTGLFDAIRKAFAALPEARERGFDAGRFSFNVSHGRCPTCEGEGFVSVELLFMPSVYAPCPTCHGRRYNEETLAVRWRDRSIADVLAMTVDEAAIFFADEPALLRTLSLMQEIGLGYLRLGQPATELSGGEAQRIKLATELQRQARGHTLYVLDEPTTGLHAADVDRLMSPLQRLVDAGHSVVLVEHQMRVVAACDWVIDLGPGAGEGGGRVVAAGTPAQIVARGEGATAACLGEWLDGSVVSDRTSGARSNAPAAKNAPRAAAKRRR